MTATQMQAQEDSVRVTRQNMEAASMPPQEEMERTKNH